MTTTQESPTPCIGYRNCLVAFVALADDGGRDWHCHHSSIGTKLWCNFSLGPQPNPAQGISVPSWQAVREYVNREYVDGQGQECIGFPNCKNFLEYGETCNSRADGGVCRHQSGPKLKKGDGISWIEDQSYDPLNIYKNKINPMWDGTSWVGGQSMQRGKILDAAKKIINGERQDQYGYPEDSFALIAKYWSTYLDRDIKPKDVAMMMALLKIAREQHQGRRDNLIDCCGYIALAEDVRQGVQDNHGDSIKGGVV